MKIGKKPWVLIILVLCGVVLLTGCTGRATPVQVVINGQELQSDPLPQKTKGQVLVPLKELAQALGVEVVFDEALGKVLITTPTDKLSTKGEFYLQGLHESRTQGPDIKRNFISATDLVEILDDDKDKDLSDYRAGHNGGDELANDPLIVDVRTKDEYDAEHIPGAIWFAGAADMGREEYLQELQTQLGIHTGRGGKKEIVIYCYTGHQSSLVAGVLGAQGINARSLLYGFDLAWSGSKKVPTALKGPMEGNSPACTSPGGG